VQPFSTSPHFSINLVTSLMSRWRKSAISSTEEPKPYLSSARSIACQGFSFRRVFMNTLRRYPRIDALGSAVILRHLGMICHSALPWRNENLYRELKRRPACAVASTVNA
jgi:hypothetical protein